MNRLFVFLLLLFSVSAVGISADSPVVVLAKGGEAKLDIVISAEASEDLRTTAKSVVDMLGKISSASFAISTNEKQSPAIRLKVKSGLAPVTAECEHYWIQTVLTLMTGMSFLYGLIKTPKIPGHLKNYPKCGHD